MRDIKRLIKDTYTFRLKADSFMAQVKDNMSVIKAYFDKNNVREIIAEKETDLDKSLTAKLSERVNIDYDADKLKVKLEPEIFNEIVEKTYVINDIKGLTAMLKEAGVSPAAFKKFVEVRMEIDRTAVRRLYDSKDITKEDLKGCFTAKVVKSIKITPTVNDD